SFYSMLLCSVVFLFIFFFFSSRRRHTRFSRDWSSDVCSSDLSIRRAWDIPSETDDPRACRRELRCEADRAPIVVARRAPVFLGRSEERRVGKECRSRWSAEA